MIAITLSCELLLMTIIGFFTQKIKLVNKDFDTQLTRFLLNIAFPCLIFNSIIAEEFSPETLKNCAIMLVCSVAVCLIQLGLGQLYYIATGKSGSGRITRYGMVFVHYSFMGIPVIQGLFGTRGTLYYAIFLIPVRILYYTFTKSLLTPKGTDLKKPTTKEKIKNLFSPCLVAVIIGLIFWILGWKLPTVINYCVTGLSGICSPLGLILCGLTLGKYNIKKLFNIRYLKLPVIRTIILPAIFFGLTRIMILVGIEPMVANIVAIYTALPVASLTAAFTVLYDPDPDIQFEAAGSVLFATIMSIITLPLWYMLMTIV